jgi:chromosome segregation ATPase
MKLEIKDWAIIILFIAVTALSINYFFSSSGYKKTIKNLETNNETLQHKRDSLDQLNKKILEEVDNHLKKIELLQNRIDSVESAIINKNKEINRLRSSMSEYKKQNERIKKEIEKLENNPIKRVGDDLINSLKEKTK